MKTAEEILRDYGADPEAVDAVRAYGVQVREEAAKIAEDSPYKDDEIIFMGSVRGRRFNDLLKSKSTAVRKMELP